MNLCIGTGWCAQNEGHNNPQRSSLQNDPGYLEEVWIKHIIRQLSGPNGKPQGFRPVLYHSSCDNYANTFLLGTKYHCEIVYSSIDARKLPYRHDWAASVLQGAIYAYNNNMDYLYIEQDCMVHNLPAVLEFAKNHQMCYGYGKYSMYPGWAENCLIWVRRDSLSKFIARMVSCGIKDLDGSGTLVEQLFHNKFCDMMEPWPFGYGRIRPIDFTQPVFYAQQLTDTEIAQFMALEGLK